MAEWSKAADSSSVIFGCVGSNPTSGIYIYLWAHLAQTVERWPFKPMVVGSIPTVGVVHSEQSWPSGLRRCVQVAVSSEAWVRTPQAASLYTFFFYSAPNIT